MRGRSSAATPRTSRRTGPSSRSSGSTSSTSWRVPSPAQVARWTQLYKQKKPVLFYWYDPQYLNAVYDLVRIQLPKRFKGCLDDEKLKGKHACEYPSYGLDKLVSSDFAKSGSPALKVIRKFSWTSADQNFVANLISGKHMDKDKAAAAWVAKNKAKVNSWLK